MNHHHHHHQHHQAKRPSPTSLKRSTKDLTKQPKHPPKVIQVNRDVATMVDEVSQDYDTSGELSWTPESEIPPPFRPRTFSDGFLRNSSEELLLGVGCDACGQPPSPRYRYQEHWNKTFPSFNNIDLLCNCNSTLAQSLANEKNLYALDRSKFRHSYVKANNSYHRSLDRKHVKTKSASVVSFLPRHVSYADPNSSIVKKIKRNLSSLKKIGGDASARKTNHGVPLSEMPQEYPQQKFDLGRRLNSANFNNQCIFSSSDFSHGVQTPDFVNCNISSNFEYPVEAVHKQKGSEDDNGKKQEERHCEQQKMPRRIMSYSDIWKEGLISGYNGPNEPFFAGYDREPTVETIEGGYSCRGPREQFKREDLERDMIMLETKQNLAGYHHCLCENHTRCMDKSHTTPFYHPQDEKMYPPAPDVTGWTGGAGVGVASSGPAPGAPRGSAGAPKGTPPWPVPISQSSSATASSSRLNVRSRQWSLVIALVLLAGAAGVAGPLALRVRAGAPLDERLEMAARLLHETPLIDGHNDLPWNIRKFLHNRLKDFKFDENLKNVPPWSTSPWSHTDLPRLKQGRVSAQFWAAYVPCDSQHRDAVQLTFEQIDVIRRLTEQYQPTLTLCTSAEDIRAAHNSHRLCSLVGVEGGHALGGSLGVLRALYTLGVRYLTLTSTCNTPWADCALTDLKAKPEHGGLTHFGKLIVKEMNRLGIIVDLSHVSIKTMKDAIAVSKAPVIFSHSSAHALCNTTRNVPDSMLRRVAANRGLVMVNFYSKFLTCNSVARLEDVIAHINHIKEIAGVDNVGLGAGYDGINYTPERLKDVSSYPYLFAELMNYGWTVDELKKLAGLNLLRVMEAVEKVSDEQKAAGITPYEDTIQPKPPDPYNCSSQDLF